MCLSKAALLNTAPMDIIQTYTHTYRCGDIYMYICIYVPHRHRHTHTKPLTCSHTPLHHRPSLGMKLLDTLIMV